MSSPYQPYPSSSYVELCPATLKYYSCGPQFDTQNHFLHLQHEENQRLKEENQRLKEENQRLQQCDASGRPKKRHRSLVESG